MIEIVEEPIRIDRLRRALMRPSDGACVVFEGVVRDHAGGKSVCRLEYEGHAEMAARKLEEIRRRALERFDASDIAVVHRLGRLEIGERSVAVLVTAAHRAAAFEACMYVMDALKAEVPIFKHEYNEDGDHWIEGSD